MTAFQRPDFPMVNLSDVDLARLGYVSVCEARAKSALVWSLKALEAAALEDVPSYQKLPTLKLIAAIEVHSHRLAPTTLAALEEVKAIHEPTQLIRNRLIHGLWGGIESNSAVMFDMRQHAAFEADHLQHGVVLTAEFARVCHQLLMEVANEIRAGRVIPAPRVGRGMSVKVANELVYF